MLVKFYCDAYEDVVYLENVAQLLLSGMGQGATIPGAVVAQSVPQALQNLQQFLSNTHNTTSQVDCPQTHEPIIPLLHRALPLLNLLKAAIEDECDILWSFYN